MRGSRVAVGCGRQELSVRLVWEHARNHRLKFHVRQGRKLQQPGVQPLELATPACPDYALGHPCYELVEIGDTEAIDSRCCRRATQV
jgi:hypothetical protein